VHPIAKRLPGHSGEPGCCLSGQAVQRVGERQQPSADPTVAFTAGKPPQLGCVAVAADRQRPGHGGISEKNPAETPQPRD
jgi:hypothetical protein